MGILLSAAENNSFMELLESIPLTTYIIICAVLLGLLVISVIIAVIVGVRAKSKDADILMLIGEEGAPIDADIYNKRYGMVVVTPSKSVQLADSRRLDSVILSDNNGDIALPGEDPEMDAKVLDGIREEYDEDLEIKDTVENVFVTDITRFDEETEPAAEEAAEEIAEEEPEEEFCEEEIVEEVEEPQEEETEEFEEEIENEFVEDISEETAGETIEEEIEEEVIAVCAAIEEEATAEEAAEEIAEEAAEEASEREFELYEIADNTYYNSYAAENYQPVEPETADSVAIFMYEKEDVQEEVVEEVAEETAEEEIMEEPQEEIVEEAVSEETVPQEEPKEEVAEETAAIEEEVMAEAVAVAPVVIAADESAEADSTVDIDKNILKARYKTVDLETRFRRADDSVKEYYSEIKNFLMSYQGVKSRISKKFDTFTIGRFVVAKIALRGSVLNLYLALASETVEEKYFAEDVSDSETYEKTPTLHKVKSKRGCKYGIELIREIMEALDIAANPDFVPVDYVAQYPPEDIEEKKKEIAHLMKESVTAEEADTLLSDEEAINFVEIVKDKAHTINKFMPINKYVLYADEIDGQYQNGDTVTIENLMEKGILPQEENVFLEVRERGEVTHKLHVEAHSFSMGAVKMFILTDGKITQYK